MGVQVREKKKGSGVWWVFINHNGKRRSKRIGKEKAAHEVAEIIEAKLKLGEFDFKDNHEEKIPSLAEYSRAWIESYIKPLRRNSTYVRYDGIIKKYLNPEIGEFKINEIQRKHIRDLMLKKHKEGMSRSSLEALRNVASGIMWYAVDEELIDANPVSGVFKRLNLQRNRQVKVEPFNQGEVDLFLSTCQKHYPEHYPFFFCGFRTGMRLGEIIALHWGDIDFNGGFIRVERSYRKGIITKPKNGKTRRVDMSDQLRSVLKGLSTQRKRQALETGKTEPAEIIFHRDGGYMEQKYIRRIFKRVLKKAGLRQIRLHDIRHTYASLLLSMGKSPVYVKEQLGHSSIDVTVDIYGHWIPSGDNKEVNALDNPHPSAPYTHPTTKEKP